MKPFLFILAFLFSFAALAQPNMRHFTVDDGLPSSNVYGTMQDSRGYIWVYTDRGIARFDGYKFEAFTTKDGLIYNDIWGMKEDSKGRIWLSSYATHFMYFDYKDEKFYVIENKAKVENEKIKSQTAHVAVEDINGDIWYYCGSYLFNVFKNKMKNKGGIGIVSTNKIINEFIYIHDKINKNGYRISYIILSCQKNITDKNYIYEDSLPFNLYKNIACGNNRNSFYLKRHTYLTYNSCEDKLYYFSSHYKKEILLSSVNINSIPLDKEVNISLFTINNTEILINTSRECFVIDTNLQRVQKYDFLKDYAINRIEADKEDNRWISTRNDGLYLLTKESATTHTFIAPEINQDIRALTADATGRIFGGTAKGDIFYIKENKLQKIPFTPPSKLHIRDMIIMKPNTLVIAGENYQLFMPLHLLNKQASFYETKPIIYKSNSNCYRDTCQYSIYTIKENTFFVNRYFSPRQYSLTANNELLFPFAQFFVSMSITNNTQEYTEFRNTGIRAYTCVEGKYKNKNIWLGTTQGLMYYWYGDKRLDEMKSIKMYNPITTKCILDMAKDKEGNIWVGTDGSGLYRVKTKEYSDWKMKDFEVLIIKELKDKIIKAVFIDVYNQAWVATNQGAYKVSVSEKNEVKVKRYSIAQGLPTNEVNCLYVDSVFAYIGTTKGLCRIPVEKPIFLQAKAYTTENITAPLNIRTKVNGKDTTFLEKLYLSYSKNNLRFDFVCLSYKSDKNITYYIRLNKNDLKEEWQKTIETNKYYPSLLEGDYTFEVKAIDIDGNEMPIKQIMFHISPPFWRSNWFKFISFLTAIIILFILYRWQIKELNKRNNLEKNNLNTQLQLEKERAERNGLEAKYKQKITLLESMTLLSQMNPHFIFNALASIQSFIPTSHKANSYLANFASLIRKFLTASREKYVPITDEYEMIKNYVELEQLRFVNMFDAEILITENTDLNIEIPPMFIQPFVENAINHGLKYKESKGNLQVIFSQENENTLLCIIEDDGVGRKKANEVQKNSLRGYKSLALKIIEERIEVLERMEDWRICLQIIDKQDAEGNATGTRVELRFEIM